MASNWFEDLLNGQWLKDGVLLPRRPLVNFVAGNGMAIADRPPPDDATELNLGSTRARPMFYWSASGAPAVASDRFVAHNGAYAGTQATSILCTTSCTIGGLRWTCAGTPLATDSVLCVVQVNGVDSALSLTIPPASPANTVIIVAASVGLTAGDRVGLRVLQSGATAQANWFPRWSAG